MASKSRKEQNMLDCLNQLSLVLNELHNRVDYVFIGPFANIAYNHFRANPLFEILLCEESKSKACAIFEQHGFVLCTRGAVKEYSFDALLIRIWSNGSVDALKNTEIHSVHIFDLDFVFNFPSYSVHEKYMLEYATNLDMQDVALMRTKSSALNISRHLKMYLILMFLGNKHNHSNGSISCDLCRNWVREEKWGHVK